MKTDFLKATGLAIAATALAPFALAQSGDEAGTANEPAALDIEIHEGDFATIQQFTTPGGISVWLVEEPSIPILALRMAWENGTGADPDGLKGLTEAMVYQMNEGAGDLESADFMTRMEELNMSFSCGAGREATYCSSSMLVDNIEGSMDLIALALNEPRFDEGPFERWRRESLIGLKTRETNANYLAGRAIEQALYPDHPFARDTSEESITAITREDALEQKSKIMVQDGLYVTAVGAVSPEELAPLLDEAFSELPETTELTPVGDVDIADPLAEPITVDLPQPQSLVQFVGPAMARDDEDFFPAYVLNYTFGGGGFESRLMKTLRVEKGLTYGIYTGLSTSDPLNLWMGGGQTKNESAGEFVSEIINEMTMIAEEGVTEEELSDAKAYLTGSYPLGFDSNSKIASNMMSVRLEDLGVDYFDRRNAMVEAVTLDDVNAIAAEYLQPEKFSFVLVGQPEGLSSEEAEPAMEDAEAGEREELEQEPMESEEMEPVE